MFTSAEVYAGDGRDYVDGGEGNDVIVGGDGDDVLYGGAGNDVIAGGAGDDHLEGGRGDDTLHGDDGRDRLSGGRGADVLHGGDGDDDLFGGRGDDEYRGGEGDDHVTMEAGESVSSSELTVTIELTGDPGSYAINTDPDARPDWMSEDEWDAWIERLDADLELLRTTEAGRESLELLDQAAHDSDSGWNPFDDDMRLTIVPYQPFDGGVQPASFDDYVEAYLNDEQLPGENDPNDPTVDSLTRFDRSYAVGDTISYGHSNVTGRDSGRPVVTLQHELSHGYDNLRGGTPQDRYFEVEYDENGNEIGREEVSEAELNAVGLDIDGDDDFDSVDTRDGHHPPVVSENALREEWRLPIRDSYTFGHSGDRDPGHEIRYEDANGNPVQVDG